MRDVRCGIGYEAALFWAGQGKKAPFITEGREFVPSKIKMLDVGERQLLSRAPPQVRNLGLLKMLTAKAGALEAHSDAMGCDVYVIAWLGASHGFTVGYKVWRFGMGRNPEITS